jgi:hypothetical protein
MMLKQDFFLIRVCALKANIKFYDRDEISSYDIFGTYSKEYHKIHIQLLDRLYKITNEEIFKYYRDKWRNYEKFPFILRFYMKLIRFYIKNLLKS